MSKFIVYQVLPRLFGNYSTTNKVYGSIVENGCGKFRSFTTKALEAIRELGVTHVWYTGIIEHATQTSYASFGIAEDHPAIVKGKAGSAYAIKDYYDVDPDLAEDVLNRMVEFENLVKRTHRSGLKVIIDFVPNHVARQYASDAKPEGLSDLGEDDHVNQAFSTRNNFYYLPDQKFSPNFNISGYEEFPAKATGNDQFTASPSVNDWYETVKLNYGVDYLHGKAQYFDPIPDTWHKMLHVLLFWANKKVDGFRCDMAEMVPVEFWHWAIRSVKNQFPDIIFIAEVYNPAEYRNYLFHGGFDYLYDKVGMYDLLKGILCHGIPASHITHAWQSLHGIEDRMLHFLENHDEQRIASDFFAGSAEKALPALIVSAALTNAPFMLYAGQELGEEGMDAEGFSGRDGRTTIFDYWGVASFQHWANKGKFDGAFLSEKQHQLRSYYARLLNLSMNEKAISQGVFYDLQYANMQNHHYQPQYHYSFLRKWEDELMLIVVNFSDQPFKAEVMIPADAIQYLKINDGEVFEAHDLLNDVHPFGMRLQSDLPVTLNLPAANGVLLKLTQAYEF